MHESALHFRADNYRLEHSIGYLINRLAQQISRELDQRMVVLGLTDAQWKPLLLLQQGACTTATDIARVANLDTGALTRLIDRIEDKGLIRRLRSAADRRVFNLELTDAGRQIADQVPSVISDLTNQLLHDFSAAEFEQFKDYLARAMSNLHTPDDIEKS